MILPSLSSRPLERDGNSARFFNLLFEISAKGTWKNWIAFCLRGTIEQSREAVKCFDKLLVLRSQYMELLDQSRGNIRLNRLIEHLFESPAITIPQLAQMCNITYPTARADLERLVNVGILIPTLSL